MSEIQTGGWMSCPLCSAMPEVDIRLGVSYAECMKCGLRAPKVVNPYSFEPDESAVRAAWRKLAEVISLGLACAAGGKP